MARKVELFSAFYWRCPDCRRTNFVKGIVAELTPDEQSRLRWEQGIDEAETGDWLAQPRRVQCRRCRAVFQNAEGSDGQND